MSDPKTLKEQLVRVEKEIRLEEDSLKTAQSVLAQKKQEASSITSSLNEILLKEATARKESSEKVLTLINEGKTDEAYSLLYQHMIVPSQLDLTKYILLEGERKRPNRTHKYPDINVAIHRLGLDPRVEALNLGLRNTANEQEDGKGPGYIGDINHEQANRIVLGLEQGRTLVLPVEYNTDFIYDLLEVANGNFTLKDGNERNLDRSREIAEYVLDEMFGFKDKNLRFRNPWRAEWLDNRFGNGTTTYHKFDTSENLVQVTEDLDPDTLMEDRRINLGGWVSNPTPQGFAREGVSEGKLISYFPRDGYVARFGADSDGAFFNCGRSPQNSGPSLGVREARKK